MNREEAMSEKVAQANPENGKGSTDSRNAEGKDAIPNKKEITQAVLNANLRNPLKTGLFAKELILTDHEKVEFRALRQALQVQLKPSTALQEIAMDAIACCCWRCKLSVRREMRRVSALLDAPDNQKVESEGAIVPRWYAAGRQELLSGIRWLDGIRNDFAENGLVRDEWKQPMDITFGPQFHEALKKWTPMDFQAILGAMSVEAHAKLYGLNDMSLGVEESPQITIDPNQGHEMAGKLIEQELRHLQDLHRSWEQRASESARSQNAASVDFWRYYTTASRDLHRAVEWFLRLREKRL